MWMQKKLIRLEDLKKSYSKPALSYLGSIKELTSGGSGAKTENNPRQPNRRP